MELRDYLSLIKAHWLAILALIVLGGGAGAAYTLTQEPVYSANASGFVTTGTSSDGVSASVNDALAKSRAASYVDLATSRAVADLVVDDLNLSTSAGSLVGHISVSQPENTVLIKITARDSTPKKAQALADAWVRALSARVAQLENPQDLPAAGILGVEPIEKAALPGSPISPQPKRNIGAGALVGLFLGLLYALVRNRLDRRLQSPEAVEARFGTPIVGVVPETRLQDVDGPLAVAAPGRETANWGTAEAYRKLRTNLAYMKVDNPPKVIVVTSPGPREGKSTTAANLAAAIAMYGERVTLVDADLRRPTIARTLGLIEGAGLTDVLIGRAQLDEVMQNVTGLEGEMKVLASGSTPPNPSELLGSFAMQRVLADLAESGYVVIDAPPLLPVTDGAILTRHSDGALVIVRHGETLDEQLTSALGELEKVQGTVLGVVFNRVPVSSTAYGYYGRYVNELAPPDGGGPGALPHETESTGRRRR